MAHLLKQVEGLAKGEGVSYCLTSPFPSAFHLEGVCFVGALSSAHGYWCPRFARKRRSCCPILCTSSLGGPGFRTKRNVQQKCTIFFRFFLGEVAGTSTVDSVPLLLPLIPSHPSGRMQLQAVNTAELTKMHTLQHQCRKQVWGTKQWQIESKRAEPKPSPSQIQHS